MNIQEKFDYMSTGKPYNDLDPLLLKSRQESVQKTTKLNNETNPRLKEQLFRKLVGSAGKSPSVKPNFRCEFGRNIHVGNNFYANYDCIILDGAKVTIGSKVLFGPKVGLYTSNHLYNADERELGGCVARPISIGGELLAPKRASIQWLLTEPKDLF